MTCSSSAPSSQKWTNAWFLSFQPFFWTVALVEGGSWLVGLNVFGCSVWTPETPATQRSSISSCREASYCGMSPGTCILTREALNIVAGWYLATCIFVCLYIHVTYVCMCDIYVIIQLYILYSIYSTFHQLDFRSHSQQKRCCNKSWTLRPGKLAAGTQNHRGVWFRWFSFSKPGDFYVPAVTFSGV